MSNAKLKRELTKAKKAVEAGNLEPALTALIAAWRTVRLPQVARLVEQVSDAVAPEIPKLESTRHADREIWTATERKHTLAQRAPLLKTVCAVPKYDGMRRLERVMKWSADPRTTARIAAFFGAPPYRGEQHRPMFRKLCAYLVAEQDPAVRPLLQHALDEGIDANFHSVVMGSYMKNRVREVMKQLPADPSIPSPEIAQLLEDLQALVSARDNASTDDGERPSEDELWAQVYANPNELSTRAVLGDALQERGDPRGEFIALQLLDEPTPKQSRRIRSLLKAHRDDFLGELLPVLQKTTAEFRCGFLHRCTLATRNVEPARALIGHPAWATVQEIGFGRSSVVRVFPPLLFENPTLRSVQVLHSIGRELAEPVLRGALPNIEALELSESLTPDQRGLLVANESLPALKRLCVLPHFIAEPHEFFSGPTAQRLEHFELDGAFNTFWLHQLLESPIPRATFNHPHWIFELERPASQPPLLQVRYPETIKHQRPLDELEFLLEGLGRVFEGELRLDGLQAAPEQLEALRGRVLER